MTAANFLAASKVLVSIVTTMLGLLVMIAPLGFVLALRFGFNRMQISTMRMLFWAFSAVMGMSLSTIFLIYSGSSIATNRRMATFAFSRRC